jgi:hypothetical protein
MPVMFVIASRSTRPMFGEKFGAPVVRVSRASLIQRVHDILKPAPIMCGNASTRRAEAARTIKTAENRMTVRRGRRG